MPFLGLPDGRGGAFKGWYWGALGRCFGKGQSRLDPSPHHHHHADHHPFDLVPVFQVFQVILSPMAFGRPPSLERASGTQSTPPPSSRFQLAIDLQQRQAR